MSAPKTSPRPGERPATAKAPDTLGRDCIFLKDWVIDCNIGVYAEEKGVTQKVRLTVDAYLAPHVRAANDDMDTVPSYTDIIDASPATTNNPIYAPGPGFRRAWTGKISPDAYARVGVDLPASAAGKTVRFQWVWGSDSSTSSPQGWNIDTVQIDR